jgi:class 3 adenylate cyclase
MSVNPVKRKLAAILAADAVGYSRMMAADEEGTVKILSVHRSMIDGIIEFHEGRIINTAGDSVLAEFASPTQAVRCAVEIQDALKTRNDALPEERRMHFRIGVNLGDVMVKGDDLLGDGVNVAARLEGIAEPGKIYVSSSVYDQIAGKLDLGFVDLGEQSLKNIDRPIRAYRVDRDSRRVTTAPRKGPVRLGPWLAAGAALLAVGAGVLWFQQQQSEVARARAEAEEARKNAASASAAAEAAKRALEEQRIAELRAKAQAELASATKARHAAEEQAAAKPVALAPSPAAPAAARWAATFACGSSGPASPSSFPAVASSVGNAFALAMGRPGEPASLHLKGTRAADGRLILSGQGLSGLAHVRGQAFSASIDGRFDGPRYEGRGKMGERDCTLVLLSEAAAAKEAADLAALHPGPWTATVACAGLSTLPPAAYKLGVVASGRQFDVRGGKPGQPGAVSMSGARQPDGSMRVAGKGIASSKEFFGQAYSVDFGGRFAGERFEGRGKFGTRDCALVIARR